MSENVFHKFREKFIEEANSLLDSLEKDLLSLEKNPDEKELLESAFRAMHTMKGISAMYGFDFISEYTHFLENIFQNLREGSKVFSKEISEISFLSIDHIHKLLDDEKLQDADNISNHKILMAKINELAQGESPIEAKTMQEQVNVKPEKGSMARKCTFFVVVNTDEQMFFRGISLTSIIEDLSDIGEIRLQRIPVLSTHDIDSWGIAVITEKSIEAILDIFLFIDDQCIIYKLADYNIFETEQPAIQPFSAPNAFHQMQELSILDLIETNDKHIIPKIIPNQSEIDGVIRQQATKQMTKRISVDAGKLDYLMYLVSELITINSQLMQATKDRQYLGLRPYVESLDSLSKNFRNNALEIRLVPLSDIALRFQRLIRDLSKQLNKKIEFVTEGIETELDKNTIDLLAEPLMHIVRNCIDHGIETPENRKITRKPETGIVKLSALQSGNYVFVKIEDDGSGIDKEKVRLKAVEKGILKADDKPSDKELFDIIFLPGFSTAQSLTEVSGRGVGMDVVKKKISDLRGEIIISSEKGVGTSFTLKLQQSIAIIDSLLFNVEDNYFIVPMSEVEVCIQEDINFINTRQNTGTIIYNEELIPFINLRKILNIKGFYNKKVKLIIIRNSDRFTALMADEIIGEHQAVLKPMGKLLQSQKYLLAASQLGDGSMSFMLNTGALAIKTN
jgi:two-component system chemotaxis sensor kinase CheA